MVRARYAPVILIGRLVRAAARLRKPGGGSAVPGLVMNRLAPGFLREVLGSFPGGLVIVSGSSGKSTTTKMLVTIAEAHGRRVFTNPSTANIAQGITSAILERVGLDGRVDCDLAILEMDEGHGARLAPQLTPAVVVLTNVMTDQIDRFWDSEKVLDYLAAIAGRATAAVVTNADDAMLEALAARLAPGPRVLRFGVTSEVLAAHPHGLGYTRTAAERSAGGVLVTAVEGREASLVVESAPVRIGLPAKGVHYAVDAAAALSAAHEILGPAFDLDLAVAAVSGMRPVFARGEVTVVRGQEVEFLLVQNPASFQLNVDALDPGLDQVLFAMGSDVRDPSYFWPVDARRIGRVRWASGSKAHEIALQLSYQGVVVDAIEPDVPAALDAFLALPPPLSGRKTIIFTADAMRRSRAHLALAEV